jgi:hypothetical protein
VKKKYPVFKIVQYFNLVELSTERATFMMLLETSVLTVSIIDILKHTFSQTSATTSGLAKNGSARRAKDDSLSVAEDSSDIEAT